MEQSGFTNNDNLWQLLQLERGCYVMVDFEHKENIWLQVCENKDDYFVGVVQNDPHKTIDFVRGSELKLKKTTIRNISPFLPEGVVGNQIYGCPYEFNLGCDCCSG